MPLNAHKFYITPKKRNYETNDLCYCSSCYYNTLLLSKKQRVERYSVKKLAALAGVSVRTLHLYDQIGLLKPSIRTEKKYRLYGRAEALRLQQILFLQGARDAFEGNCGYSR